MVAYQVVEFSLGKSIIAINNANFRIDAKAPNVILWVYLKEMVGF